jgi:hypothetical protein
VSVEVSCVADVRGHAKGMEGQLDAWWGKCDVQGWTLTLLSIIPTSSRLPRTFTRFMYSSRMGWIRYY